MTRWARYTICSLIIFFFLENLFFHHLHYRKILFYWNGVANSFTGIFVFQKMLFKKFFHFLSTFTFLSSVLESVLTFKFWKLAWGRESPEQWAASMVAEVSRSSAGWDCMEGWPATWAVHGGILSYLDVTAWVHV